MFSWPLVFCPEYIVFVEMTILKNFLTVRNDSGKVFWEISVPEILKNIERLEIRAKSFENAYRSAFFVKL